MSILKRIEAVLTSNVMDMVSRIIALALISFAFYWHGYYGALNTEGPVIEAWVSQNCEGYAAVGSGVYYASVPIIPVTTDKTLTISDEPILGNTTFVAQVRDG